MLQDGVALEVVDVMTGTFDYGTLTCCEIPCPAAGKTGTTELQSDAWTVGFTPQVSTAVWVGNPDARVPAGLQLRLAGPIWHDYMAAAAAEPCDDFPAPKDPANLSAGFGEHTVDPSLVDRLPTKPTPTSRPTPTATVCRTTATTMALRPGRRPGAAPSAWERQRQWARQWQWRRSARRRRRRLPVTAAGEPARCAASSS